MFSVRHPLDLGDVGPCNEVFPSTREDHGPDRLVLEGLHNGIGHLPNKGLGELVDRWVVEFQDGHPFLYLHPYSPVIRLHVEHLHMIQCIISKVGPELFVTFTTESTRK